MPEETPQQSPDEQEIQQNIKIQMEQLLKDISEDDQSSQAIVNLAAMISLLYKSLVESGLDNEVALSLTSTYVEVVVHTMLNR